MNVTAGGTFKLRVNYAGATCKIKLQSLGGSTVYVGSEWLPATANYDTFATYSPPDTFSLSQGPVSMSIYFIAGGCDIDSFDIYPVNCNSSVCCATTCLNAAGDFQCGSTGCSTFGGGADRCCTGNIAANNYSCAGDPLTNAPCVLP